MPVLPLILLALAQEPPDADLLARAEASFRAAIEQKSDGAKARPLLEAAARDLTSLHERGVRNPTLALQLGNARLLADDLAGAIVAYHQGLARAPTDAALLAALDHARSQVAYPAGTFARPPVDDLPPWLPRPGPLPLFLLLLACFTLGCVALTRQRMTRTAGWLTVSVVAFLLTAALGVVLYLRLDADARRLPLVVIAEDGVLLRRGDGLAYPARYDVPLPRGAETRLRRERGDWLQIELSGGEVGWVPRALTRRA